MKKSAARRRAAASFEGRDSRQHAIASCEEFIVRPWPTLHIVSCTHGLWESMLVTDVQVSAASVNPKGVVTRASCPVGEHAPDRRVPMHSPRRHGRGGEAREKGQGGGE